MFKTMYPTLNETSTMSAINSRAKDVLKSKLSYEWRNIYRLLTVSDKENKGTTLKEEFERCSHQCRAFLTKEDMNKIL